MGFWEPVEVELRELLTEGRRYRAEEGMVAQHDCC